MSLTDVKMSEEVWLTCVTHALSTETEEIMGLLLGDIECSKSGKATALIWGASPQTRSDRRKDRVETNPEQLAAASALAERMSIATGRRTRVIGWYHSHPHITVLPSHVDVRTQAMYQLLDSGFIGLIFSCFNEDAFKVGRIQVIAFQSSDGRQSYMSRPVSPPPVKKNTVIELESSLSSDDLSPRLSSKKAEKSVQDTGDSKNVAFKGTDRIGGNPLLENTGDAFVDVDAMDMSDGLQEAMNRSHLDMSGAEYIRKEVPLQVVPASSLLKLDSPLASFTDLQHVLYEEEKAAYNQAISHSMRDGKVHPLAFIHHTSTYQASMCKLMEHCLTPAIKALEDHVLENEIQGRIICVWTVGGKCGGSFLQNLDNPAIDMLGMLTEEAKALEAELSRGTEGTVGSPHRVDVGRARPSRSHSFNEPMNPRSPTPASPSSRSRK